MGLGMARRSGGRAHHFVWAPPGRQGASPLEVPIGIRNFGIPKLSDTDSVFGRTAAIFRTILDKHIYLLAFQKIPVNFMLIVVKKTPITSRQYRGGWGELSGKES